MRHSTERVTVQRSLSARLIEQRALLFVPDVQVLPEVGANARAHGGRCDASICDLGQMDKTVRHQRSERWRVKLCAESHCAVWRLVLSQMGWSGDK
jgi:hypothetical protein